VTVRGRRGPIVIDTDVFGAELGRSPLVAQYEPIIVGRPALISFQTAAELRYGALRRQWGEKRMRELEAKIAAGAGVLRWGMGSFGRPRDCVCVVSAPRGALALFAGVPD
jgi:hypothetical protein